MSLLEVEAAHEALRAAMLRADAAAMDRLLHPDLTYSHSNAKTETKAEAIAAILAPGGMPKSIEFRDGATRVYGHTAIYTGKGDFTTAAGASVSLTVLMVWIKAADGWQLVARQATRIP